MNYTANNIVKLFIDAIGQDAFADFYDYKGNFLDQYVLGEAWIVGSDEPYIANMDVGEGAALAMYKITDVYGKEYWTGVIPEK